MSWGNFRRVRLGWRAGRGQETLSSRNFLDGDLIESYDELVPEQQNQIAQNLQTKKEILDQLVEELMDLH